MADPRRALERHVVKVQRTIRSCAGCGMCCTDRYNAVQILPLEGQRIAAYLDDLPEEQRSAWQRRIDATIRKYRLREDGKPRLYTCAFLEDDFRCALPLDVKPTACLSFNPITEDSCDQEPERYESVHQAVAAENRAAGLDATLNSIPIAVRAALRDP